MNRLLRPALLVLAAGVCMTVLAARLTADTISIPIISILDDLEESLEDGAIDVASSDIELGVDGPPDPRNFVGLRFVDVGIPALSTINSASVQFMVDEDDDEVTNVRILGELAANSAAYADMPFNLTSRDRTTNSVLWSNIPVWTGEGTTGPDQRTPDISAIIQEIIDQPGWAAGNALSVFILPDPITDNTGERTAISFDKSGDPANAGSGFQPAILNVDFTPIPEPSTWAIAAIAGILLAAFGRRRAR
jgi:hypothetical protein